jgi:hypothetical protein
MAVKQNIKIPYLTWLLLVTELRKRGKGRQESGVLDSKVALPFLSSAIALF